MKHRVHGLLFFGFSRSPTFAMQNKVFQIFLFLFSYVILTGCHQGEVKKEIRFEVINSDLVVDSLAAHIANYKEDFNIWQTAYEQCQHDSLFHNAFYLGLQTNLGIGSISNLIVQNINRQITVFDTSANGNIMDILAIHHSANCFAKINLSKDLQDTLYNELIRNLNLSGNYKYLTGLIDSNQIAFKIGTLIDYSIRPDTLVNILQRTQDSSLLYFRQILTTPGNALLVRAGMIFGFYSEFHLKRKITPAEEDQFNQEVFFNLGSHGEKGSIKLMADQILQVYINRNYTVFGQFYSFTPN